MKLILLASLVATMQGPQQWEVAEPDYEWDFPRDHWVHTDFKTEWWYLTGHLDTPNRPNRFGYQFTFFRVGVMPGVAVGSGDFNAAHAVMGHAALTDNATGKHYFSEVVYRAAPVLGGFSAPGDSVIAWSQAPPSTEGEWRLWWNGSAFDFEANDSWRRFGFELSTSPLKPLIYQGPNGYSVKADSGSASLYYSFTRLETNGVVTVGDSTFEVVGTSWMDKEFGSNQLQPDQTGWDWFSLQLNDGRELMLYRIRGSPDHYQATLVDENGSTSYLEADQWTLEETGTWRSGRTDTVYPMGWLITVPDARLDLSIEPTVENQENVSFEIPSLYYWEGAVVVTDRTSGDAVGRGFVELTGYGDGSRPVL